MNRNNKMPLLSNMRDFYQKSINISSRYSNSLKINYNNTMLPNDQFIFYSYLPTKYFFEFLQQQQIQYTKMNQGQAKHLRTINKIYPPQLSIYNNRYILYSPLQQWVQSHSQLALQDLIEIDNNSQPLYLNQTSQSIIMQSNREVFLQNNAEEWMRIEKSLKSQKEIISNTIQMKQRFVNIDSFGRINSWKKIDLLEQENPESQEINEQLQNGNYQTSETTLDMQNILTNYENGYDIAEISSNESNLFLLERIDDFKRIIALDTDFNGQGKHYQCYLPKEIAYLYPSSKGLFAYGDHQALYIDDRSETVAFNILQNQYDSIASLKQVTSSPNKIYIANRNKLQQVDLRKLDDGPITTMDLEDQINDFQFLEGKESISFCISFKAKSKVQIISVQHLII